MPKYIDLTICLEPGMRGVDAEVAREKHKDGWNATTFHLYSHCGTHMDAPLHFDVNATTLDEVSVDRFFVDCWMVRLPDIKDKGLITVNHVSAITNKINKGEGLLFYTGWSNYIGTDKYRSSLPRFSEELARWCVDKHVGLIGVEPPSVADVNNIDELTKVHTILLGANIQIIEGLTNLDKIGSDKVKLIALPLKISNSDGAPARVIAIEE